MTGDLTHRAKIFRDLHTDETPLVLPNALDAGSARLIEEAGARAVATTSGGVAWSHGLQDGDQLPVSLLTSAVESIVRSVSVPVSVDVEGGYSDDLAAVETTISGLIDAGAVGINIEDGFSSPDWLCRKLEAAARARERSGVPIFINARTDVYLRGLVAEVDRVDEVARRSRQYGAAGADGIFAPRLSDADSIRQIAELCNLPLNVMACPGLPPISELSKLGVRRLSAGTAIAEAAYSLVRDLAAAFLHDGDSASLAPGSLGYAEINSLLA